MLKFAYNTNGLRNMRLEEAIKQISNHNYDGVEISLHKQYFHPLDINIEEVKKIKSTLKSSGLVLSDIATGCDDILSDDKFEPSIICKDSIGRKKRIELLVKTAEFAEYLGVDVINFATGFKSDKVSSNEAYDYLKQGINYLLLKCPNTTFALEPEPGMFIEKTEQAINLINEINNPRLMLNLDIGHVYCCEEDPILSIRKSIPYTRHIHIEDIKNRVHYHQIPGTGDIDFYTIFKDLIKYNYQHYISVELYHHADDWNNALDKSIKYLKQIEQHIREFPSMELVQ
ncbi:MAG: sugar phosphate isomerase/epimerase family protein [Clostridium botulinum]|nr:sugar phosphate isomerase/epimerase family protein [Clostridium botulinum]